MICDICHAEIHVGDWPFCDVGGGHSRGTNTVVADDVPGGFVVENGFDRPTRFDSKSDHQRALAARGLELRVKNAGPEDKIISRWDTVDLDAAKTLLERGPQARRERADRWPLATEPITVTVGGVITSKDLA